MRAPSFLAGLSALVLLSTALADFGDPQVVILDWQAGQFAAGTLGLDGTVLSRATWNVWVDGCHRKLRADLLYEPSNATVAGGPLTVEVPFDFRIRVDGPNWSLTTQAFAPGFDIGLGTAATMGAAAVSLELQKGAAVDWSFRLRGWEVVGETGCTPLLVVNEVESNPVGVDVGGEWVELYNPTSIDLDAGGWVLETTHGVVERLEIAPGTLVPHFGHAVVSFADQFLDNENESLVLTNPVGQVVDSTPIHSDGANDGRTWQRTTDGAADWVFRTATRGATNNVA